jgi:hypothetical protein
VHHAGVLHFVGGFADGTRGLLPEWMADQNAAKLPLIEAATLSLAALRGLWATLDGRLLSSASFNIPDFAKIRLCGNPEKSLAIRD